MIGFSAALLVTQNQLSSITAAETLVLRLLAFVPGPSPLGLFLLMLVFGLRRMAVLKLMGEKQVSIHLDLHIHDFSLLELDKVADVVIQTCSTSIIGTILVLSVLKGITVMARTLQGSNLQKTRPEL